MTMKKQIVIPLFMLCAAVANAQKPDNGFLLSGSVIYQQIAKLNIKLDGDGAAFADALPKEQKSEKILHFSEKESLYENYDTGETDDPMPTEQGGVMIKMSQPDNRTFSDLVNHKVIEQKEFMSRLFLVESEMPSEKWKLTGNQKRILEYPCQEAVREEDSMQVVVWFTPTIPVPAGPGEYVGLPGLVLAVESHDGDRTLEAVSVDLKPLDKAVLKPPTKGKKVTVEAYEAMVAEKLEEMGVEHGAQGGNATWVIEIKQ
jgi:GLPGLI family protein